MMFAYTTDQLRKDDTLRQIRLLDDLPACCNCATALERMRRHALRLGALLHEPPEQGPCPIDKLLVRLQTAQSRQNTRADTRWMNNVGVSVDPIRRLSGGLGILA